MFRVVPVFFKDQWGINEAAIGVIMGLNGAIIALFEMVMINQIENRKPAIFFIVIGAVLFALSYLILSIPFGLHIAMAILTVVIFTIGEMFVLPFINTVVISRSNAHNRGLYAAGYTLSWSIAQVSGPVSGFFIAKHFGYNCLWAVVAGILLLCAFGFRLLGKANSETTT